jgi:phosphate transport system substrate-binding protein
VPAGVFDDAWRIRPIRPSLSTPDDIRRHHLEEDIDMKSTHLLGITAIVTACLALTACSGDGESGSGGSSVKLTGAGASFPYPIYNRWFKDFCTENSGIQIDYQSVGSGAGVKNLIDGTVDFGASDAAMKPDEMDKVDAGVQLLPLTAGGIVLAYNIDGVKDLKLSREAYIGIFMGKITKWNDEAIAKDNPGAKLPDAAINVVVRADSSGTTFVFTKHLAAVSTDFESAIGVNKAPNWPVGTKSKGNEGVTQAITSTPNSIGYIEYGYAKNTNLPMATLQNKAGKFVAAEPAGMQAALGSVEMPEDLIAWIPDPEGADCYPIVTYTWLLCYKSYDADKCKVIKDMVNYCLTEGQNISDELGYIALPENVVTKVKSALDNITEK